MVAHRLENAPLEFQMHCRLGKTDYFDAVRICAKDKISQAALVRIALRQYVQQQKAKPLSR